MTKSQKLGLMLDLMLVMHVSKVTQWKYLKMCVYWRLCGNLASFGTKSASTTCLVKHIHFIFIRFIPILNRLKLRVRNGLKALFSSFAE